MGILHAQLLNEADDDAGAFAATFRTMTAKQQEVLSLLLENRTSKEIAAVLGVSESAINQRIENVRERTGFLPRARLARAYQRYLMSHASVQAPSPIAGSALKREAGGAG